MILISTSLLLFSLLLKIHCLFLPIFVCVLVTQHVGSRWWAGGLNVLPQDLWKLTKTSMHFLFSKFFLFLFQDIRFLLPEPILGDGLLCFWWNYDTHVQSIIVISLYFLFIFFLSFVFNQTAFSVSFNLCVDLYWNLNVVAKQMYDKWDTSSSVRIDLSGVVNSYENRNRLFFSPK